VGEEQDEEDAPPPQGRVTLVSGWLSPPGARYLAALVTQPGRAGRAGAGPVPAGSRWLRPTARDRCLGLKAAVRHWLPRVPPAHRVPAPFTAQLQPEPLRAERFCGHARPPLPLGRLLCQQVSRSARGAGLPARGARSDPAPHPGLRGRRGLGVSSAQEPQFHASLSGEQLGDALGEDSPLCWGFWCDFQQVGPLRRGERSAQPPLPSSRRSRAAAERGHTPLGHRERGVSCEAPGSDPSGNFVPLLARSPRCCPGDTGLCRPVRGGRWPALVAAGSRAGSSPSSGRPLLPA